MPNDDTICAISSATGSAERMIVRLSGPRCRAIIQQLSQTEFTSASAIKCRICLGGLSVPVIVYTFVGPRSATGEDVAEFHLPGNPLLARMMLNELFGQGIRAAEPGEFTARAYFNGRLDLPQAEAIATIVSAENLAELSAARKSLGGELARRLSPLMKGLADTLALIEASIDFSEEEIQFIADADLRTRIAGTSASLSALLQQSNRFERLSHEPTVLMLGRPNAGKSSLFNALIGDRRAVVSDVAGTTRDVLDVRLPLPRGVVRLLDVAGLEPAEQAIELLMQSHAVTAIQTSDILIWVRDCTDHRPMPPLPRPPDICLASKSDLGGPSKTSELSVGIHDPKSLDALRAQVDVCAFGKPFSTDAIALNARHVRWIDSAVSNLSAAAATIGTGSLELTAADLRNALNDLGEVLGQITPDDVLGKVFSRFCIGK